MERALPAAAFERVESRSRGALTCTIVRLDGAEVALRVWRGEQRRLFAKYPDWRSETMGQIASLAEAKVAEARSQASQ